MFGLVSVLAFLGVFVWLGLSADAWDKRVQHRLLVSVVLLIALLYIAISIFWVSRPFNWESSGQY
jgi:hypothetical protein